MADNLKWIFELVDKMTGPAKKIRQELDGIKATLPKVDQNISKMSGGFGAMDFAKGALIADTIKSIASAASSAAIELGKMAVGGALDLGKFTVQSVSFREDALVSLEAMLRSKQAADKVYKDALALAKATPFDTREIIGTFQSLIGAGFQPGDLNRLGAAMADVASIKGGDMLPRIALQLSQIRAKGRLQGEELLSLSEAGVGTMDIYEQIAKVLGKPQSSIQKLVEAGKVNSQVGITAIVQAIEARYGGMADKRSRTLTGLLSTLTAAPFELIDAATAKSQGPGGFDAIKDQIKSMTDMFSTDSAVGQNFVQVFRQIGEASANMFKGVDMGALFANIANSIGSVMPEIRALFSEIGAGLKGLGGNAEGGGLTVFLSAIVNGFRMAWQFGKGFIDGLMKGLAPLAGLLGGNSNQMDDFVAMMAKAGETVGFVVGIISTFVGTITMFVGSSMAMIRDLFADIKGWLSGEFSLYDVGVYVMTGLIEGLQSMGQSVYDTVKGIFTGVVDWVKRILGIQSPSKVFAEIGEFSALGFVEGFETPDLQSPVSDALDYSNLVPDMGSLGMRVGGSGFSVGSISVSAPVHLAGGDVATKEAAERAVERILPTALAQALEDMALEYGFAT